MSKQYLDLIQRTIDTGEWIENKRTGKKCLTVINASFEYDLSENKLPVLTTKKSYWKPAIAEMLGYLRGYTSAADFRGIGCNTWGSNANENEAWLNNPHRKGKDDLGKIYGAIARDFGGKNLIREVYDDLRNGIDSRGEIITFYKPDDFDKGCLRPCMHTHTFSIIGDKLYLTSYQRSDDLPLGHGFNQIQVGWLLMIMAQITGLKPAKAFHHIVNAHIYEDQLPFIYEQLEREPYDLPTLKINQKIKTLEDLETWVTLDDFELIDYNHHEAIKFPFSV
jgi:thymidylate synthase